MKKDTALLVVDFDFFFPRPPSNSKEGFYLYDWSHRENELFIDMLWTPRAETFIRNNMPLPGVKDWQGFWERFDITPDAKVYTDESNAGAINPEVEKGVSQVWLYDAHHDAGYDKETVAKSRETGYWSCDDWMAMYADRLGVKNLHARYPLHRVDAFQEEPKPVIARLDRKFDDPAEETPTFGKVFVCRSGAWVPPWCDDEYHQFLAELDREKVELRPLVERSFDLEKAKASAKAIDEMMARAQADGLTVVGASSGLQKAVN